MTEMLTAALAFLAGAAIAVLIFVVRWRQAGADLHARLDTLVAAGKVTLAPSSETLTRASGIAGVSKKLSLIIVDVKKDRAAPVLQDTDEKVRELKALLANARILNELGQQVTSSLKLEDAFRHLYGTVNSLMDAAVFELGIFHWKENTWSILSNGTVPDDYHNHIAEWAMKNNREVLLDDAQADYARYVHEPPVTSDGRTPASVLSFPIIRHGREVGALTVMSFTAHAFDDYHRDMLRSLIPYTAVAVGNALIHEELISTQEQLIHNEKMASLGHIASGIAHEILNPLNFVNNFSQLSKELVPELDNSLTDEEQRELKEQLIKNLDKIQHHGQRAYGIVKNMMMLGRSGTAQKASLEVNRAVDAFVNMALSGFQNVYQDFDCRIERTYDPNVTEITIVGEDFGSVLLNILNNAFYTMNDKRKRLSAIPGTASSYEPQLSVRTSLVRQNVVISIQDNGMGIPEEIRSKIFLPFFTTKPTGEGTGLGLSISHDIITKGNKGELSVLSDPEQGTEMIIKLPMNALID